ncbi:MAG TPA: phosphoenolpyruvate--protein phosphotransferase [Steroidobacteraceae bacterium]|jgi:phosphocarrier protein FPr/phosphocarrier protein|nr:phosphoenolpyruvate--protein phosphotransferase [Steroidobacteraceae bacterium]
MLLAPFAGWCAPLDEVPDAAFAQRMLGDGVAIDPTGNELRAPCDGEVISIAASRHAVALRAASGAEILMHVGIDTVGLAGESFHVQVRKGDRVRAGDLLLTFDLDLVGRKAPSLMTPVIITNGERFRIKRAQLNRVLAIGEPLFELEEIAGQRDEVATPTGVPVISEAVVVTHAHGIHARPAALIARIAKGLPYEIEIRARGRGARARSTVALMSLGIRGGDEVVIAGFEPAAAAGIAAIVSAIRNLEAVAPPAHVRVADTPVPATLEPDTLRGVIASRGLALGTAFYLVASEIPVIEAGQGAGNELLALERARDVVRARLTHLSVTAAPTVREIMTAHLELLDDPELIDAARSFVADGKSAAFAWRASLRAGARELQATGDARLAERVDDLLDLETQVLLALDGSQARPFDIPPDGILLARDLTPSQLIDLDTGKLGGIVLGAGGPTSHVAILAGTLGIPMLVAAGPALLEIPAGAPVALDAEEGVLRTNLSAQALAATRAQVDQRRVQRALDIEVAQGNCHLASGERIEVLANLTGTVADAKLAVVEGAEGCGLLRTEFLFLERATAPDRDEQLRCYQQVAQVLGGRPLVIRTLDIGGDKPIPYLPLPPEDNPALGLRGVRTSLWRPDLLEVQLRALLGVRPTCRILLPMITDVAEIRAVRQVLDRLRAELRSARPLLGAMIETPAAAMLAGEIAREVDFLSIGTNDLAQYTLAMDRGHAELAARIDGLHPAVLRLIDATCRGAAVHQRPVAVCGGLASDPAAVAVLLGLGVSELSVVPKLIPQLKSLIRRLNFGSCRTVAGRALALESAEQVRAAVHELRS